MEELENLLQLNLNNNNFLDLPGIIGHLIKNILI